MDEHLKAFKVAILRRIGAVYGITAKLRKQDLVDALCKVEKLEIGDIEELTEKWEDEERREKEALERERQKEELREAREHELALARIEAERRGQIAEQNEARDLHAPLAAGPAPERSYDMSKFLRPFREDSDMGLFLVNFERVCTQMGFERETWSLRLMTVLPAKAAEVVARLPERDSRNYDQAKASLLKRYRLTPEAFRSKFRNEKKNTNEGYAEFSYRMKANFDEWVRAEKAHEDHEKLVQLICLEQFYSHVSNEMKFWIEDKNEENTLEKAAELADEFVAKRGYKFGNRSYERYPQNPRYNVQGNAKYKSEKGPDQHNDQHKARQVIPKTEAAGKESTERAPVNSGNTQVKHFEKKRPIKCFNCQGFGHFSYECNKPKVAWACLNSEKRTDELLKPYLIKALINGRSCQILRDSAATYDVVSEKLIGSEDYTGKTVYLRAALTDEQVCLPIAKIKLIAEFGEFETEAAVSNSLPSDYPYLLSNRTWEQVRVKQDESGSKDVQIVQALTRSMARAICESSLPKSNEATSKTSEKIEGKYKNADVRGNDCEPMGKGDKTNRSESQENKEESVETDSSVNATSKDVFDTGNFELPPCDEKFSELTGVNAEKLILLQKDDESLKPLWKAVKNTDEKTFYVKKGILHRQWSDKDGKFYDQIVLPTELRPKILHLAHNNSWSGHLGVNKTVKRIQQEFWWPQLARDVKVKVKCCDICMRTGKPNERGKQQMCKVPIISEPYERVIIDVVGPLKKTDNGNKYLLTMLCAGTKFAEAVPMPAATSENVVNALLQLFSRTGFPKEIQSDLGSVFVSALTTTFFERCGIKVIHSSVSHPQSNSVERYHSTIKRMIRALCYERKRDWDLCMSAAMFALRSTPNETTGFSPAELLYGRQIRGPLNLIRENWEGREEVHPTVVEYILTLLERFKNMRELVEQNSQLAQDRSKKYYDKKARQRQFKVGDKVLVFRPVRANKLEVHWSGPEIVAKRLSDTTYLVERPTGKKKQTLVHVNLLKPYFEESQFVSMTLTPLGQEETEIDIPELECAPEAEWDAKKVFENSKDNHKLSEERKSQLCDLIDEYPKLFSDKPGSTTLISHDIVLKEEKVVTSKTYHHSPRIKEIIDKELDKMIELGRVRRSDSEYSSPILIVEAEGKDPRPVIDYRALNAQTVPRGEHPIPNVEECVETFSQAKYLSKLDLVRGYWQVPMTERAIRYSAFITHRGKFEPVYMSFGLKGAPFTFQKLMDRVLEGFDDFARTYQDDICVSSNTWEEHLVHLRRVFERLLWAGLTIKASKCVWGQAEVIYLGHVIGQSCRKPEDAKVATIRNFGRPVTKRDLRAFLGLSGYYNHYISNYAEIASPLTDALRKNESNIIKWDDNKEKAFNQLKQELMGGKVLRAPDYSREFILQVDCSQRGMGLTLSQINDENEEHPVLYLSKKLTPREQAYGASELECCCLIWGIGRLKGYLFNSHFTVESDHDPLRWLHQMSPKNGRLLRWSLTLQPLNFTVKHKKGANHKNVDGLSRYFA